MICPNCNNEIPDDSIFCVDCGKKLRDNGTESPSAPECECNENSFTEAGILYYSLNPSDECPADIDERWIHGNNCGGTIYIGNNAICVCGKCHKSSDIKYWHKTGEIKDNIIQVDVSSEEQPLQDILKILPVNRAGLKWLNEITSRLITKN
ncbi:MAG: zinc ribbon domain-containing protein [Bacteroides sp.]|nr:zinc ribbon domain-containing protein [Bacteroides sp.]MBD5304852.1 zinc ribbon domain-containing protein [Bacteroides sp.]